jgi:hypothetical protein
MATITKLSSGSWRVQVRRKGRYASESFKRLRDAQEWAIDIERSIDRGSLTKARSKGPVRSFGDVIDLHRQDMLDVGRPPRRSKAAVMATLKVSLVRRETGRR